MVGIDSDARIVIAEGIVKQFIELVQSKRIPLTLDRQKTLTRLNEIKSKLLAMKWSYKPLEQILRSNELRSIEINAKDIFDSFPTDWEERLITQGLDGKKTAAELKFLQSFFYTLRDRLKDGFSDDYALAIDILCGEIISVEPIDSKNWKCIVADGRSRYTIVTNIPDIKKGEVVPIAKLPPQIVHGELSGGMFAGSSKGLQRFTSEEVGKRPDLSDKDLGQTRGLLEQMYVKRK
jgi:predicted RNA-binding protein with EMAP domain